MNAASSPPPDPLFDEAVLTPWRTVGQGLVADYRDAFDAQLEPITSLIAERRYTEAALRAQIAANHAVFWHPGRFASLALERALYALGRRAMPMEGRRPPPPIPGRTLHILHVASKIGRIGGHTKMMSRWIDNDSANIHSVALTRQYDPVPETLEQAVGRSGGTITRVNHAVGGLLAWARGLQALFARADLVVLHVHNMDVIPFLAMAGMRNRPPVILLNHADHLFWLGNWFVDLVVNTRSSGAALCLERRGIAPERNLLLPLCLESLPRRLGRTAAKQTLALPEDSIVILTVARAVKFKDLPGASFADGLLPVLRADPHVHLVAVGPRGAVDWSKAEAAVPGRIHCLGERPDVKTFFEAADIYVDSFPFPSITSLFEAGLHGLPLVARHPFPPGCEVLGADSPGLDGVILRARSAADFQRTVERLIQDPAWREDVGARTQAEIESTNMGAGWTNALHAIYKTAFDLPQLCPADAIEDSGGSLSDLDLFSPFIFGNTRGGLSPAAMLAIATETDLKAAPPLWRIRKLAEFARRHDFGTHRRHAAWRQMVPEWLGSRVRSLFPRRA